MHTIVVMCVYMNAKWMETFWQHAYIGTHTDAHAWLCMRGHTLVDVAINTLLQNR